MKTRASLVCAVSLMALAPAYSQMNPPQRFTKLAFADDHNWYFVAPDYSPVQQTVQAFTAVELECVEPGVDAPVWTKNGAVIAADGSHVIIRGRKLQISYFFPQDEGAYAIKGFSGSPALLKAEVSRSAGELMNSSARARVQSGSVPVIHGFVLSGSMHRSVLIRAVGPSLKAFGLSDVLLKPRLLVYDSHGAVLVDSSLPAGATAKSELDKVAAQVGAFPLPEGTADVALVSELAPGPYTAVVLSADGGSGDVLVETYLLPLSP